MTADDDKILNIEQNQLILERDNRNRLVKKLFYKTWSIFYFQYPSDINDLCIKYLKPNTLYGVHCFREGPLYNEYELMFKNSRKAVVNNF